VWLSPFRSDIGRSVGADLPARDVAIGTRPAGPVRAARAGPVILGVSWPGGHPAIVEVA
jgi:hypothetical protein